MDLNWKIITIIFILLPALRIEILGQTDPFEVRIDSLFIVESQDQTQQLSNSFLTISTSLSAAQSFTAGMNGEVFAISIRMGTNSSGTFIMTVSAGSAPGGSVLSLQTFQVTTLNTYLIPMTTPFPVNVSNQFTITITVQGGTNFSGDWYKQNTNVYTGGTAFIGTGTYTPLVNDDMVFTTYVRHQDSLSVKRLRITDEGLVGTKEYLFPLHDGSAGQVLMTNGNDSVSWQTQKIKLIADMDNETKIQVEKNPDEDVSRMDVAGNEVLTLKRNNNGDAILQLINANTNFFVGRNSGLNNTGFNNSAFGFQALQGNIDGFSNTGLGVGALQSNTSGYYNTGIGATSLLFNTTGTENLAVGAGALYYNSTGSQNTALGASAMQSNTTGIQNIGVGAYVLGSNTTGSSNSGLGTNALIYNTTGSMNTAIGRND